MEQEYKWKIPQATLSALADYLHGLSGRLRHDTLHMAAVYYDTADSLVYKNGAETRIAPSPHPAKINFSFGCATMSYTLLSLGKTNFV